MKSSVLCGALCAIIVGSLSGAAAAEVAEEEELSLIYGDKETIRISTGRQQALRRAPSVATVITAEDIAAMGARDLDEVLETVPGVHVSNIGSRSISVYQFRGINGNPNNPQVLLMQNGVPLNTLYRGDKGETWGGMPLENVARVEIIRGPGSALYGANAFAGAINIITKSAAEVRGTEVGLRAGSFSSRDAWVQHGGSLGPVEMAAYIRLGSTAGARETIATDAQSARDKTFGTKASLAPGPFNGGYDALDARIDFGLDKWRMRIGYHQRDNIGTGSGVSSALDPAGWNKGTRFVADLDWSDPRFGHSWELGFAASYLHQSEDEYLLLSPPGSRFATGLFPDGMIGNPQRKERQIRLSGYAAYSGLDGHNLRFGAGHDDLDMYAAATHKNYLLNAAGAPVPSAFIDYNAIQPHILPQRRKVDYVYAQDEWNFARDWSLTAGVRHDRYSDVGGTTNPRLAVVWDASLDVTVKLLHGEAFRAPSFTELYGINPVSNGNPGLKPETIKTSEAAIGWQVHKDARLNLSAFRYDAADLIRAVANPAPAAGATFRNIAKQHGSGAELEAVWDARRTLRLTGHYAYQQSVDETTGTDPGYVPRRHLYLRADWRATGSWLISVQANQVADRHRAIGDIRPQVPDYTTVDLTIRTVENRGNWNFAMSLRNLFDAAVFEPTVGSATGSSLPNDLPMAGRSLWLQASFRL